MARRTSLVMVAIALAISGRANAASCFQPLANPSSKNPADWRDLIDFVAPKSVTPPSEIQKILTVASGRGTKINLDYYSVTFRKHATMSLAEFFLDLRQHFAEFAQDNTGVSRFEAYPRLTEETDPIRKRNAVLWRSNTPTGALMTFVLNSVGIFWYKNRIYYPLKNGDVFVTCSSPTDFIFSTVYSNGTVQGPVWHPVSGNRGFGLKDNGDSTWTFYSQGADRETSGETKGFVFANILARGLERSDEGVFLLGEEFWQTFYAEMIARLKTYELNPSDKPFFNGQRYDYPLPPLVAAQTLSRVGGRSGSH